MILTLVFYPSNLKELVNVIVEKVEEVEEVEATASDKRTNCIGFCRSR